MGQYCLEMSNVTLGQLVRTLFPGFVQFVSLKVFLFTTVQPWPAQVIRWTENLLYPQTRHAVQWII